MIKSVIKILFFTYITIISISFGSAYIISMLPLPDPPQNARE